MKHNPRAAAFAALLAVTVVLGAMSGATAPVGAAAPTIDTSTTDDTTTVTDVQNEDTIGVNNSFEASGSNSTTVQYVADSNNSKVYIEGPDGVQVYENTSADTVNWNTSSMNGNFNVSVNHGALDDLERGINQNVTTTWYVTNNTSAASPETTNFTVYVESDDSKSVEVISDADVDEGDIASVTENSYEVLDYNITAGPLWADKSDLETESRDVNGSATDVVVVLGNSSVQEDFTSITEDVSDGAKLSSFTSLNRNVVLVTNSDDETMAVPVYFNDVPDDVEDSSTYVVQKDVGGQESLVLNLGDSYEDADSVSVKAVGGAGLFTYMDEYLMSGVSNWMPGMLSFLPSDLGGGQGGALIGATSWVPMAGKRLGA